MHRKPADAPDRLHFLAFEIDQRLFLTLEINGEESTALLDEHGTSRLREEDKVYFITAS